MPSPVGAFASKGGYAPANSNASSVSLTSDINAGSKSSVSNKFYLSPDPTSWAISHNGSEPDDALHNPRDIDNGSALSCRGAANLGCLLFLALGLLTLFMGYPLIIFFTKKVMSTAGGFNLGGINATGQVPAFGHVNLIDPDTPKEVYTKPSWAEDGAELRLVFSDEFNVDGRSFYPGDDPFWEAHNLHYWGTNNMEWYDPSQLWTEGGKLYVSLDKKNPIDNHNLGWAGGMMSTWNKFCFTGGILEASIMLPGANNVQGLWPAFWSLGNLGRAGYGASLEGTWPYSYDECDVGTLANQTLNGLPEAALTGGSPSPPGALSFMPGQRLSRCTCEGEEHPGPRHADGTYVGRSAPEIDVIEATVVGDPKHGEVSQSGQFAPFNKGYQWNNAPENYAVYNSTMTMLNPWLGSNLQQATSGVSKTNQQCYQHTGQCYSVYAFEYKPGFDDAYITWISDNRRAWRINVAAVGPDPDVQIGRRPIPQEPMYIILNLGMSRNFGDVDLDNLLFPAIMMVDYVRVYQHPDRINTNCDPIDFPTAAYINANPEAYNNPNLTTWTQLNKKFPKNKLIDQCDTMDIVVQD